MHSNPSGLPFLHPQKNGDTLVDVHVTPNAAQTRIQGLHDDVLHLRLHAPPVDGKANLALQTWLANALGVPKSAIDLVRGAGARRKQLRISARYVDQADWSRLRPEE